MPGSRLGTAPSVSLFSPVQLVLEVKMLLLLAAGVPSLAAALGVSLQPSHPCISWGYVLSCLAFGISLDPFFLLSGDFLPSLSVLF